MENKPDRDMAPRPKPKNDRWYPSRMRRGRVIAQTCCVLLGLALPVWNSGQHNLAQESASAGALKASTDLQIESPVLRIEFDRNLHSRVIPQFGPSLRPLVSFSASETVTGAR